MKNEEADNYLLVLHVRFYIFCEVVSQTFLNLKFELYGV